MADPYTILGISRDCDQAEIKKAYRKLAKDLHPDRNKDKPDAATRFAEVTQAYDLLNDAEQRARYDRGEIDELGKPRAPYGFEDFNGYGPFGGEAPFRSDPDGTTSFHFSNGSEEFADIFADLFGGGSTRPSGRRRPGARPRGDDVLYHVKVGLEDLVMRKPLRLRLEGGENVDVTLPPGADTGTRIRLPGKGREGPGGAGDALLDLEVKPHPFFKREGGDIRLDLPIRWDEAVLGAKIRVPTVDGSVLLSIPKGSSSGKVLRIKGKGLTNPDGSRGNQLVRLLIEIPSGDKQLQDWAKEWRKDHSYNPRAHLGV